MRPEMEKKVIAYKKAIAEIKEKENDLTTLLSALPPGQVNNLLKDPVCGPILSKYGINK